MFYFNESMGHFRHILPDIYEATTIDDFVKNVERIPKPSHWKKLNPLAYLLFGNKVVVSFTDVNLEFCEDGRYLLSDMTGEIYVQPAQSLRSENITEGTQYIAGIAYHTLKMDAELAFAKKFGPPSTGAAKEPSQLELALEPA